MSHPRLAGTLALVGSLLLLPCSPGAAPVTVTPVAAGGAMLPQGKQLRLTARQTGVISSASEPPLEIVSSVPGTSALVLDLAPGLWEITAATDGLWFAPAKLEMPGDQGELKMRAWRSARLEGKLVVDSGEKLPESIEITIQSPPGTKSDSVVPRVASRSPLVNGKWTLDVPAATLDMKISSEGFVPHYLWDVPPPDGTARELAPIRLQKGASIAGFVHTAEDAKPIRECVVGIELLPDTATAGVETPVSTSNDRGFFQVAPLPAGDHLLTASARAYAPASVPIAVQPRMETLLTDPLLLSPPVRAEVSIDPPIAPGGSQWHAELIAEHEMPGVNTHVYRKTGRRQVPETGTCTWNGLSIGSYILSIGAGSQIWHTAKVEIRDNPTRVDVVLGAHRIRGVVTLGDEPIAARIGFGGTFGAERVDLASGEDGGFHGTLPHGGRWMVEVRADAPAVARRLDIELDDDPAEETVELRLPDTRLTGEVLDEEGRPVRAVLSIATREARERRVQIFTDEGGRFEVGGLRPGLCDITGEARCGAADTARDQECRLTIDPTTVNLREGGSPQFLRCVARGTRTLRGRVTSSGGGGVAGAQLVVTAFPPDSSASHKVFTGSNGQFAVSLPRSVKQADVHVGASGYVLQTRRVSVGSEPLEVSLPSLGGTLVLEIPDSLIDEARKNECVMAFHDGVAIWMHLLQEWAQFNGTRQEESGKLSVPNLDAGEYEVCSFPPGTPWYSIVTRKGATASCVRVNVTPGGRHVVTLPAPSEEAKPQP